MNLAEKVAIAREIQKYIYTVSNIWPGFTPFPFILYDEKNQVAVGNDYPERFSRISDDIWAAEGPDPDLMGCTAVRYHNHFAAIWDTRTLPNHPSIAQVTAGIAHEMFHCFQMAELALPFPNELLRPRYPHTARSVALLIAENRILAEMYVEHDPIALYGCLKKIASLRRQRVMEVGPDFLAYDNGIEGMEGTAAYVEIQMAQRIAGNAADEANSFIFPLLAQNDRLLADYRLRCMASGAVLCLSADALCPKWQSEWTQTRLPIFAWLRQKLALGEIETEVDPSDRQTAEALLSSYAKNNERKIADFLNQPLISFEDDIHLLRFDPMNLVCHSKHCLHTRAGIVRLGEKQVLLERPFLTEVGDSIVAVKRILIPETEGLDL